MIDPLEEIGKVAKEENRELVREAHKSEQTGAEIEHFIQNTLLPALEDIKSELTGKGLRMQIARTADGADANVTRGETVEFQYAVCANPRMPSVLLQITYLQRKRSGVSNIEEMKITGDRRSLRDISKEDIQRSFLKHYREGV